jgi:high-affinity Fe2+/Pb2+ permease
MKTKITLGTLLVVVVAMLMVLGTPRHARAKNGCSNASLQG